MSIRDEIHAQIEGALKNAKFPIKTPEELLAAMPAGAATKCKAGDCELTAGDAGKVLKETDFPFKSAKEVADVIVERAGL
ncbi:MAG: MTH865 family protein [Methanothrix sp.]